MKKRPSKKRAAPRAAPPMEQSRVPTNASGQTVLDPVLIPEREAWLFRDITAVTSVLRGIEQAKRGEVHDPGSFAPRVAGQK